MRTARPALALASCTGGVAPPGFRGREPARREGSATRCGGASTAHTNGRSGRCERGGVVVGLVVVTLAPFELRVVFLVFLAVVTITLSTQLAPGACTARS